MADDEWCAAFLLCGPPAWRSERLPSHSNGEGIQLPGELYYQRQGRSNPRRVNHLWNGNTIKAILRNEAYIGNMVQGKCGTLSCKSKKLVEKPKDQWIRVEGTHEAIITRETWDTVAGIDQYKV